MTYRKQSRFLARRGLTMDKVLLSSLLCLVVISPLAVAIWTLVVASKGLSSGYKRPGPDGGYRCLTLSEHITAVSLFVLANASSTWFLMISPVNVSTITNKVYFAVYVLTLLPALLIMLSATGERETID